MSQEQKRDLLTRLLSNLVINALQAAPKGGHVRVRTSLATGGGWIAIAFSDDGAGIPRETQEQIFQPYYTTKPDGSGLGLWITQQIVLAHGGTIRLESDPGRGATFTLTIPLQHHPKE